MTSQPFVAACQVEVARCFGEPQGNLAEGLRAIHDDTSGVLISPNRLYDSRYRQPDAVLTDFRKEQAVAFRLIQTVGQVIDEGLGFNLAVENGRADPNELDAAA